MDQEPGGPVMPTQEERTQAMLCWVLSIFIGFISPLIFMLTSGKEKAFVYANAMQCLTMMLLLWVVLIAITIVTCGIGAVLYIVPLIFSILGAVSANNGKIYEPPITGPLAKKWFNV
jgi:uncharacterized membrane protein